MNTSYYLKNSVSNMMKNIFLNFLINYFVWRSGATTTIDPLRGILATAVREATIIDPIRGNFAPSIRGFAPSIRGYNNRSSAGILATAVREATIIDPLRGILAKSVREATTINPLRGNFATAVRRYNNRSPAGKPRTGIAGPPQQSTLYWEMPNRIATGRKKFVPVQLVSTVSCKAPFSGNAAPPWKTACRGRVPRRRGRRRYRDIRPLSLI